MRFSILTILLATFTLTQAYPSGGISTKPSKPPILPHKYKVIFGPNHKVEILDSSDKKPATKPPSSVKAGNNNEKGIQKSGSNKNCGSGQK